MANTDSRGEGLQSALSGYYRFHSRIYDATRWAFLFGRQRVLDLLPPDLKPARILEVGCGTGKNLVPLAAKYPQAQLVGVDLSGDMLAVARRSLGELAAPGGRVELIHAAYSGPLRDRFGDGRGFDLVLFSYALTMMNPGWESVMDAARADLNPGGLIAVVDFHDSPSSGFRSWMGVNHVRMEGHLLPRLREHFRPRLVEERRAYGGFWRYLLFHGERNGDG